MSNETREGRYLRATKQPGFAPKKVCADCWEWGGNDFGPCTRCGSDNVRRRKAGELRKQVQITLPLRVKIYVGSVTEHATCDLTVEQARKLAEGLLEWVEKNEKR